jgi:hypothetical protein
MLERRGTAVDVCSGPGCDAASVGSGFRFAGCIGIRRVRLADGFGLGGRFGLTGRFGVTGRFGLAGRVRCDGR